MIAPISSEWHSFNLKLFKVLNFLSQIVHCAPRKKLNYHEGEGISRERKGRIKNSPLEKNPTEVSKLQSSSSTSTEQKSCLFCWSWSWVNVIISASGHAAHLRQISRKVDFLLPLRISLLYIDAAAAAPADVLLMLILPKLWQQTKKQEDSVKQAR